MRVKLRDFLVRFRTILWYEFMMRPIRKCRGCGGMTPVELVCALGALVCLTLIAAAPTHRILVKARAQAQVIRYWDAHQAALAEMVASAPWAATTDAASAK